MEDTVFVSGTVPRDSDGHVVSATEPRVINSPRLYTPSFGLSPIYDSLRPAMPLRDLLSSLHRHRARVQRKA
jgi:hypothetical protein